ncbi:HDOD domain-containing protein [Lampropedia puyangensis]|uniref:HDOD domain-containing protein n=1 Tax=Lampropedia puyangensis TaxID=1330072 RepID=UPI0013053F60|nr:HDOD domain-containing protein [Lampropedia puyangensis]
MADGSILPSLPFFAGSLAFLQQELQSARPRMDQLNQGFANEPALTARLLVVCSQRWPQTCSHASAALALLSIDDLRAALVGPLGSPYANAVNKDSHYLAWRKYVLEVARIARSLARDLLLNEQLAYSAGLLHAIHMIGSTNGGGLNDFPEKKKSSPLASLRKQAFAFIASMPSGSSFKDSALFIKQWGMPEILSNIVQNCEAPLEDDENISPLAAVLHLAVWRACISSLGMTYSTSTYPAEVALSLGMDMDMVLHQEPIRWK